MSTVQAVPSLTRNQLRKKAFMLRDRLGLKDVKYFPIVEILELVMPQIDPEFYLDPVEDSALPGRSAEAIPELHTIRVKESVYNAACAGEFYARLVLAHELAHIHCHSDVAPVYAHLDYGEKLPNDQSAEWQADIFALELLAPVHLIDEQSSYLVSKHFGVSRGAAKKQLAQVAKVNRRHHGRKTAKKGNGQGCNLDR